MIKFKFVRVGLSGMMLAGAIAAVAGNAFAETGVTTNCVIFDVGVDTNGTRLTLHCVNDANHYTAGYPGCVPAAGPDQIKTWHSQAMSAMLAGKKVSIWWDNDCGSRAMSGFVMTNQ